MIKYLSAGVGLLVALSSFLPRACAQNGPVSGVYQINSGTFQECCGLVGIPRKTTLPDESQAYLRFSVNGSSATLTFLGADLKTPFQVFSCPISGPIRFDFADGTVFPDRTVFQSPGAMSGYLYTVSNAGPVLQINGSLNAVAAGCADVPTHFAHSNLVATLLRGPKLTFLERTEVHAARIMVQGQAGWTDVIEASTDLKAWVPVSTNVMDFSLCPICPFAVFEDPIQPRRASRFYRAYEFK